METGQHGKLGGWCSAGLMTLSLVAGIAGCDPTTPQINEPADFEPVPGETNSYYSRRDNPEIVGLSNLRIERLYVIEEEIPFPTNVDFLISEPVSYVESFPDGVFFRVTPSHAADGTWGRWLTGEVFPADEPTDKIDLVRFQFPRLLLNMNEVVEVSGWSSIGRNATEPRMPTDPPIGVDRAEIGSMRVQLHPDVLLVPVHFRVFADQNGNLSSRFNRVAPEWLNEEFVKSIFDPGLVSNAAVTSNDPYSSTTFVATTDRPRAFAPDEAFASCGVQFRLASYRVIPQSYRIEEAAFQSCATRDSDTTPIDNASRPPLSWLVAQERESYMSPGGTSANDSEGIDIYVTGLLRGRDAPNVECGPDRPGAGYYRSSAGRNNPIWISNEWLWFGFSSAIAHEIGHKLIGSDMHVSDELNVMSTGPSPGNTMEEKSFTDEQCRSIRSNVATRLFASGLISRERYEQVRAE